MAHLKLKVHYKRKGVSNFTYCGRYGGETTEFEQDVTCKNCHTPKFLKILDNLPGLSHRDYLRRYLHQTLEFEGHPRHYNWKMKRMLMKFVRTVDGELVTEHLWVDNWPKSSGRWRRIRFRATCEWYTRGDNSQAYGLKLKQIVRKFK